MADKDLYYLDELSDYKVASDYPDVRGWKVKDADNKTVGKVDNLLVSKNAKRVVYLDVEIDESLLGKDHEPNTPANKGIHEFINKDGENHLIVPIGMVGLDEDNKHVLSNQINTDIFSRTKRYSKGSTIDRDYEIIVFKHYVPQKSDSTYSGDDFYNQPEFKRK